MTLTWLLLILAVALIALGALGALRFDVLVARWRELVGKPAIAPDAGPVVDQVPGNPGLHPHAAPAHKPGFHRSGRRQ